MSKKILPNTIISKEHFLKMKMFLLENDISYTDFIKKMINKLEIIGSQILDKN
jgi:hypothetical protein